MGFSILYTEDALQDLEKIKDRSSNDCDFTLNKIEDILTVNPFPFGTTIKRLRNIQPAMYRLRINATQSYRVFYRIISNSIYIINIVPKRDADKVLKKYF